MTRSLLLLSLSLFASSCSTVRPDFTLCSPERENEAPVFTCTKPDATDYVLGFDQGAKDLGCLPLDDLSSLLKNQKLEP